MENNTKKPEVTQDELKKSLAVVGFTEDEITDLIQKSENFTPEIKKEEGSEEISLEDLEKAYKEIETKEDEIEKAYKSDKEDISEKKTAKMAEMKKKGYKDDKEEEKKSVKKSNEDELNKNNSNEKDELIKGLTEKIGSLEEKIDNTEEIDDIKKSVGGLTESINSIKELVTKIAETPIGMKSHQYAQFFEKGEGGEQNEDGKKVISLKDKETIMKSLENLAESTTDSDKKSYFEKAVMDYNSNPDSQLAPNLIAEIQKAENCTFTV